MLCQVIEVAFLVDHKPVVCTCVRVCEGVGGRGGGEVVCIFVCMFVYV